MRHHYSTSTHLNEKNYITGRIVWGNIISLVQIYEATSEYLEKNACQRELVKKKRKWVGMFFNQVLQPPLWLTDPV